MREKKSWGNVDIEVEVPPFMGKAVDEIGLAGFSKSFEKELPPGHEDKLPKRLGEFIPPQRFLNSFPHIPQKDKKDKKKG